MTTCTPRMHACARARSRSGTSRPSALHTAQVNAQQAAPGPTLLPARCRCRYFDAARSYGRAEEFLGGWLRARGLAGTDAAPLLVGSKWGYAYTAGWRVDTGGTPHEVKEHTAAQLGRQAAETAEHLGPWLRLYQIHSATLESGVLANAEVLRALGQLKRQRGWALGLSVSGACAAAARGAAACILRAWLQ